MICAYIQDERCCWVILPIQTGLYTGEEPQGHMDTTLTLYRVLYSADCLLEPNWDVGLVYVVVWGGADAGASPVSPQVFIEPETKDLNG